VVWIGGIARQPEEFNQLVHEARSLCIAEHSVARRRSIFRLYTHAYIYAYFVCMCMCIILIHSNRRPDHHCVRKSNLFHIYTRQKPPPRTEFDDIGRRILYTRLYTCIIYYIIAITVNENSRCQWILFIILHAVPMPVHISVVCMYL